MIYIISKTDDTVQGCALDVENVALSDNQYTIDSEIIANHGDVYDKSADTFSSPPAPPPAPPPVPEEISRRQFFQQLAVDGDISQDEALAAVTTGALPKKLSDAIASLPKENQFTAQMLICGATSFLRSHPMVAVLGGALQKDSAALDALWTEAFAL